MKRSVIWKLLAVHLLVIAFVLVIVWIAIDVLAAGYFVTLMQKYNISPEPAHDMFVDAVHRYLLWACAAAAFLAAALSLLLMRRILTPLRRMTDITGEIAAGNFHVRAPGGSGDEVGRLASAFNRMAENLEKLETLRKGLMIDVAHELRTPLSNLQGYLEALEDGLVPPSQETYAILHEETMRLVQLVEDILQLARADAARDHLARTTFDIRSLAAEVLKTFVPSLDRKNIALTFDPESPPIPVSADRSRVSRALRCLGDNALRYAPEGSRVEIRITREGDHTRVVFGNPTTEVGAEDLPFLFERFYRGEKSRSREHGGAGIGLAIVKEIVEAHRGSVGAELADGWIRIWFTLPHRF